MKTSLYFCSENRTQPKNAKLRLEGVALRSQLVMLLKKKSFYRENGEVCLFNMCSALQ